MKNTTLLFIFLFSFISFHSFSQVVETRLDYFKNIKWDREEKEFYRASDNMLSENSMSITRLAYDKITMISQDTMNLYLNEAPREFEDSIIVERIWYDAIDDHKSLMYVHLFYFKNTDKYLLRVVNQVTDKGGEYFLTPISQLNPVGKRKNK